MKDLDVTWKTSYIGILFLVTYVDDILLLRRDESDINVTKEYLHYQFMIHDLQTP